MSNPDNTKNPRNKPKSPLSGSPQNNKPKSNYYVFFIYFIVIAGIAAFSYLFNSSSPVETTWRAVRDEWVKPGHVEKLILVLGQNSVEVYLKKDQIAAYQEKFKSQNIPSTGPQCYFKVGDDKTFVEQLKEAQIDTPADKKIEVEYVERHNYWGTLLNWLFPILMLVFLFMFFIRRMGGAGGAGGIFSVGKSKAQLFDKDSKSKITFEDVAGLEEAKVEVVEIVDFLRNPNKYTALGGKIPKGALLVGPPGTGKTLLAKAVAGEANVPFFSLSGSDFVEMFVGVGASRVRDLFRQAKEKAPCIIFIDEIDAIGRARGKAASFNANDERENTLNQLLTEMDGFGTNSGVIVLAATNRAEILDKALLRAGRFDRQIHVDLPDMKERLSIFKVHVKNLRLEEGFNLDFLAKQTPGFSGADIANVCNEAALYAARKGKNVIEKSDFLDAIDRIVGGLEKKNKIISRTEKTTIAYHEAGHATVSWMLQYANPLVKVTIIPRGNALGAAWYLPEERQITTTEQLLDEMSSILGGRASEELNFGRISTGALNDLERVTKQAYAMIAYYGMSDKIKNISYFDSSGQNYNFSKPYSEKTAELIDNEVKLLVEQAYQRARQVLVNNQKGLQELADLLLEKEVIFSEDLERIFGKRPGSSEHATEEEQQPAKKKSVRRTKKSTESDNASTE